MNTLVPCFHVTTADGEVYGVAAAAVYDARRMVAVRLSGEEPGTDAPTSVRKVGTWRAPYGTVLHY